MILKKISSTVFKVYPEIADGYEIFASHVVHCFRRLWAKCLSLKFQSVWRDTKKGCRPASGREIDWDFMNPKQWGSCFPINR